MEVSLSNRLKRAWNVFLGRDPTAFKHKDIGYPYSYRPDRPRLTRGNERSIVNAVFNRIALDVASLTFNEVILDKNGKISKIANTGLNHCLTVEANIDQTSSDLIHDITLSCLDEGVIAVVPIDTSIDPDISSSFNIDTMRVGKIKEWYPKHVKVELYNDTKGRKQDVVVAKKDVAIINNPLYSVVNEPNSICQRLIRKLALLDVTDEATASGKLDIIIQLPYTIKSESRKEIAEKRRKDIEMQLATSRYGVAYADGTEHITQLNRPAENNLMKQIEYLVDLFLSQIGITQEILDGTADDKTMAKYYSRIIGVFASIIVNEFNRKFITKTARTQGHKVRFFNDPFKLVSVTDIAEIADKMTRNEIMSSNEIREKIGLLPVEDPKADELRNSNISQPNETEMLDNKKTDYNKSIEREDENQNG